VRWDRLVTERVFHPVRGFLGLSDPSAVPILMYHSISRREDGQFSSPYLETSTSPRVFEGQMRHLAEKGYSTVGLSDLPGVIGNGGGSGRFVVLTFDDGYRDFYHNAFPVLEKFGFTATVFLATGLMESRSGVLRGRETLRWEEVRELRRRGVAFGSHTVSHPVMKAMRAEAMEAEIRESGEEIALRLGEPVESFSYPYAFPEGDREFLDRYSEMLTRCGYRFGVTTVIGRLREGHNLLAMRRLPVNDYDGPVFFRAKLEGAYDWVRFPQYLRKRYFGVIGKPMPRETCRDST
jgi:peptidoglycan/xylan/chitin deacetylase (PgdA/CDA1 family)